MKKVLILSNASKYSKYPLTKVMQDYKRLEKLAELQGYEVADYCCGYGDPSTCWEEVIREISSRHIDALMVPDLASIAIRIADGAKVFPRLKALGIEFYCNELGVENLFATENFDQKVRALIRCAETTAEENGDKEGNKEVTENT